jgi:hypothetical protein
MRSRPKTGQTGLTLLEICLCLLIIGVVFGAAIPLTTHVFKDHPLQEQVHTFQTAVGHALITSSESGTPRMFRFDKDGIFVFGDSAADLDSDSDSFSDSSSVSFADGAPTRLPLNENMRYQIQLWPSQDWLSPDGQSWAIPPAGLILPIALKWWQDDSWIAIAIDPLTGEIRDMTYELH